MKTSAKVVIIHGSYGSPDENWFPWLASEVRRLGCDVAVPKFPTPEGQDLDSWRQAFVKQVGAVEAEMVFVGHSLAPAFILHLLEESAVAVRGTFLVSGFLGLLGREEFDRVNKSFVCAEFDWSRIRKHAGVVRVYNSDNDPYVPLDRGRELAEKLGVQLSLVPRGGHINASAGFTSFPRLLNDLRPLLR